MAIDRRGFIGLGAVAALGGFGRAFAAGTEDPSVGKPWKGWKKGQFQIHFIYTGVAESLFWILPDGTTMLLDCGDHAALTRGNLAVPVKPGPERLAGEWIARYIRRVNPFDAAVDYMMLSHYHADHGGTPNWQSRAPTGAQRKWDYYRSGFGLAAEQLTFAKAIDRAWPTFDDPIPKIDGQDRDLEHIRKVYAMLEKRDGLKVEKFRLGATDQVVPLKDPAACVGFKVRNICANGRIAAKDGKIRDLYADLIARHHPKNLNENGMSTGMIVEYGDFKFFTAGDFSDKIRNVDKSVTLIEDELATVVERVNVAKVNHHGHFSMPEKLVKALAAQVWVGCIWDTLHMVDPVCARLADRNLYPGDRVICPGVFPKSRREEDAGKAWTNDVAKASYDCGHIVLDVPPGGKEYTMTYLTADDESMTVKSVLKFNSATRAG